MGDGTKVKFGYDIWCHDLPLNALLELFSLAHAMEFSSNHMQYHNDSVHCVLNFIRTVHDWQQESLSSFLDLFYLISVRGSGEGKICCLTSAQKGF